MSWRVVNYHATRLAHLPLYSLVHVGGDGGGDDDDEGGGEVDDGDLGDEVVGGVAVQTSLDVDHQQDAVEDDPHLYRQKARGSVINPSTIVTNQRDRLAVHLPVLSIELSIHSLIRSLNRSLDYSLIGRRTG